MKEAMAKLDHSLMTSGIILARQAANEKESQSYKNWFKVEIGNSH